jgi:hypothetical protein
MTNRVLLQDKLTAQLARREALAAELKDLLVRIRASRDILGNPFYDSHPKHPDQSEANYTGYTSFTMMLPLYQQLRQLDAEIARLRAALNDSRPENDEGNSHQRANSTWLERRGHVVTEEPSSTGR